jgi:hypothetical protein
MVSLYSCRNTKSQNTSVSLLTRYEMDVRGSIPATFRPALGPTGGYQCMQLTTSAEVKRALLTDCSQVVNIPCFSYLPVSQPVSPL